MEIVTAFAIVPGPENWEKNEDGEVDVFEFDDPLDDFVIGTFSSLDAAKEGVRAFLRSYEIGSEEQLERIGQNAPVIQVTYWKTELDAGGGVGQLVDSQDFDY